MRTIIFFISILVSATTIGINSMDLFQIKFIESQGNVRLISSGSNYALTSPSLSGRGWRAISMNGDRAVVLTNEGQKLSMSKAELGADGVAFVEDLRDNIANSNGRQSEYTQVSTYSSGSGSGSYMMNSNQHSSSSSSFSSSSSSSSTNGQGTGSDLSFSSTDENSFSVSKSDLPFNWSRLFFNGDLITIVHKNGDVLMLTENAMSSEEAEMIERLRRDVSDMRHRQANHFSNTMSQSMDMVSNVFSNIMNQFPKPPDYRSAVGGMFGNNFPFGPNNSPFSSASGWPFGGGSAGSGAIAIATRR